METPIKFSINRSGLIFAVLSGLVIWTAGCVASKPAPDPLAGWKVDLDHQPDPTIVKDYQDYIQTLPPNERMYVGNIQFFEDGTGQHAVTIEIFPNYENASWRYAVIYDKDNKRIKVVKYGYRRYQS